MDKTLYSDVELKENITSVPPTDKAKVSTVEIKRFNFKDDETKRDYYGVIAQEIQDANLNDLVHVKEDGHLGVDYTSLLALKISYLQDVIGNLEAEIVGLQMQINDLKK